MATRVRKHIYAMAIWFLVGIFMLWTVGPIYWVLATSLKSGSQLFTEPPTYVPHPPVLDNYEQAFRYTPLGLHLLNTIKVAAASTPLSVGIAALAAFGLGRYKFRGRGIIRFMILVVRMLPGMVVAIPLFIILTNLGLVDHWLGLVIAYTAFNLPFSIWLLEGFFEDVPQELEDAARVDGCSPIDLFLKVMIPITSPGLVASTIFCLLLAWNEFDFALILTYTTRSQTLPIAIAGYTTISRGVRHGALAAAGMLAIVPVIAFGIFVQRYIVRGLTAGAIKG